MAARHARRARRAARAWTSPAATASAAARRPISSRCGAHETRGAGTHRRRDTCSPVPGATNGNMLMGYDDTGHCLMFANGGCSIYQHRPETCRTYDCRVFTAAGMKAGGDDKCVINERVAQLAVRHIRTRAGSGRAPRRDRGGELPASASGAISGRARAVAAERNRRARREDLRGIPGAAADGRARSPRPSSRPRREFDRAAGIRRGLHR